MLITRLSPSSNGTLGFNAEELTEMLGSPNEMPEISEEEDEKAEKDTTIGPKCQHEFVM